MNSTIRKLLISIMGSAIAACLIGFGLFHFTKDSTLALTAGLMFGVLLLICVFIKSLDPNHAEEEGNQFKP